MDPNDVIHSQRLWMRKRIDPGKPQLAENLMNLRKQP
jgi:hypothetical protein